jgi:hypothetical protein
LKGALSRDLWLFRLAGYAATGKQSTVTIPHAREDQKLLSGRKQTCVKLSSFPMRALALQNLTAADSTSPHR